MTALVSVIPILLLIVLMMGFKVSGFKSAIITLIVTILLALFAVPAMGIMPKPELSIYGVTIWSVVEGLLKACFPIILIIICAIFSYNILCETKEIETIKAQFIQMTSDKGLLVLLLTWGLGGVLEGMAGFGTAVAIPAAILIDIQTRTTCTGLPKNTCSLNLKGGKRFSLNVEHSKMVAKKLSTHMLLTRSRQTTDVVLMFNRQRGIEVRFKPGSSSLQFNNAELANQLIKLLELDPEKEYFQIGIEVLAETKDYLLFMLKK